MATGFEKTDWVWRDGELVRWEDATIHVLSHVVHYGSSVFEGIRFYDTPDGPAIFRLPEHIRRFLDSAKIYRMDLGFNGEQIADACSETVRRNNINEGYLRPIALRGYGSPGLNPLPCPIELFVLCWPWGAYLGDEGHRQGHRRLRLELASHGAEHVPRGSEGGRQLPERAAHAHGSARQRLRRKRSRSVPAVCSVKAAGRTSSSCATACS